MRFREVFSRHAISHVILQSIPCSLDTSLVFILLGIPSSLDTSLVTLSC